MSCHRDLQASRADKARSVTPQHGGGPAGNEIVYVVGGKVSTVSETTLQQTIASAAPMLAARPGAVLVIKAASDGAVVADVRSAVGEHGPGWMVHDHRTGIRYLRAFGR